MDESKNQNDGLGPQDDVDSGGSPEFIAKSSAERDTSIGGSFPSELVFELLTERISDEEFDRLIREEIPSMKLHDAIKWRKALIKNLSGMIPD